MSYSSTILADNPTAYYKLNETSGTSAIDSTSNAFNGTVAGGVTLNQSAIAAGLDTCMLFNGSTGKITLPTGVNLAEPFSIEMWIQGVSIAGDSQWFSNNASSNNGVGIGWDHSAGDKILVFGHGGAYTTTNALVSGVTYYLCLNVDTSSNYVINVGKVGTDSAPSQWGTGNPGGAPTYSGSSTVAVDSLLSAFFHGFISEVAIYPVTLSSTQMNSHYTAGITAPVVTVTGPKPRYITRGLLSTIIPDVVTQPLPYIDRGMLATIVYENRTFIPRAFGGVYIPDTVLWVPRAFGSTTSQALLATTTYAFTDALSASDSLLVTKIALPVDSLSASDTTLSTDGTIPLDSLTASDIGNLQGWGVDGLTASDSLLMTDSALPVESLTASDTLLTTDGSLYTEANSASDSINGTDSGLLIESLATSDSLLEQETYIPLDALTASDSLLKADTYIPIDAYSVSDIGNQQSWGIDALVASDSLLDGGAFVPLDALTGVSTPLDWDIYNPLDDNLVADDSASTMVSGSAGATTTTYSFVEALVASDSLLVTDSCIPLDALSASDIGNMTRGFIDALTATDSLLSAAVAIPIDALVASDSLLSEDQLSPYSVAATASDTFIRANQSGWGTASDSEVWSVVLGGAGNFSIASNEGQITGATPIQAAYLGTTTATDMEVLVRYTASATTDNVLIFLRGTASNTQYRIKQAGASFSINRVVAGTNTALQSATFTTTAAQAYWIRAVVEGGPASATLAAKTWQDGNAEPLKWNLSGVVDGSPITGAGQFGLGCGLTVTTDTVKYDTYTVALYASPDALSASDKILAEDRSVPLESLAIADTLLQATSYLPVEAQSIADTTLASDGAGLVDALTANDFGGMTRGFVEVLVVSDAISTFDTYIPVDFQSVVESLLADDSASWVDVLSVSDSLTVIYSSPSVPIAPTVNATAYVRSGQTPAEVRSGQTPAEVRSGTAVARIHGGGS